VGRGGELEAQEAGPLIAGLDAVERAGRRLRLQQVAVGDGRGQVEPSLTRRCAVARLRGAAVALADGRLDTLERALERGATVTARAPQLDRQPALRPAQAEQPAKRRALLVD